VSPAATLLEKRVNPIQRVSQLYNNYQCSLYTTMILSRNPAWSRSTAMAMAVVNRSAPRPLNFVGTGNKEATEYHK
jgi:hypothetical protein